MARGFIRGVIVCSWETILKGKKLGFSLGEIAAFMVERSSEEKQGVNLFTSCMTFDQLRGQIATMRRKRVALDEAIIELEAALQLLQDN